MRTGLLSAGIGHAARAAAPRAPCPIRHYASTPEASLRDMVSKRDYDAYLTHYAYPPALQPHFFALRAFHAELASIKDDVSNELIGRVRMGWWREAILGAYQNRPPGHPIALGLRDAIRDPVVLQYGGLVQEHFLRIIDAREADLADPLAPPTLADLEQYAESTSSRMLYLQLNLLGLSDPKLDELFSHIGKAIGLTIMVRTLPFHTHPPPRKRSGSGTMTGSRYAPQGNMVPRTPTLPLPLEYLLQANVVQEDVFRNKIAARGLRDAVFHTATRANDYLITARTLIRDEFGNKAPARAIGPLLLAVSVRQYLLRLENIDFDPYDASLLQRDWKMPWHLWLTGRKGNI